MRLQDAIDMATTMSEGRAKKLDLARMCIIETQIVCNRKRFWWRKKVATFQSVAGVHEYDLTASAGANATDLNEIISIAQVDSTGKASDIRYEADPTRQQAAMANTSTTTDAPSSWFMKLGSVQTITLVPTPNSVKTFRVIYWATPNDFTLGPDQNIPLVPPSYHYVVAAALLKKVFFYLFGQNDPRYMAAAQDFEMGMADLDRFNGPATREAQEFRASDTISTVRATH